MTLPRQLPAAPPTPYAEVNGVLGEFRAALAGVLGNDLVGLYLSGSLAAGDFDPISSDVDVVAVTVADLPHEMLVALQRAHDQIRAGGSPWAARLEGSYLPLRALARYDPHDAQHPALREDGRLVVEQHGSDWVIQRHILREHGIALHGPHPRALVLPVAPERLRLATAATLHEWWAPQVAAPFRLEQRAYAAYAVLTMCRARYTLAHGAVVSKPVAARWVQATLGGRWGALSARALAWRHGAGPHTVDDTIAFIRDTIAYAHRHAFLDSGGTGM